MPRRMSIVRRSDGRLAFHNAVPLDDASMREVEAWGEPGFLLVPSGFHRLDVHAFKARYPRLEVLCPAPVAARVRQAVAVDGHWDALPPDPALRAETLDGVKAGEAAFVVESEGRTSVLLGDTMMNLPHLPGFEGLVFRLLRSTGSAASRSRCARRARLSPTIATFAIQVTRALRSSRWRRAYERGGLLGIRERAGRRRFDGQRAPAPLEQPRLRVPCAAGAEHSRAQVCVRWESPHRGLE
jgi:hypothetical protein